MAYEILGYDVSAMAASAEEVRLWANWFGLLWVGAVLAHAGWAAKAEGVSAAKCTLANAGVYAISRMVGLLGGALIGAAAIWA